MCACVTCVYVRVSECVYLNRRRDRFKNQHQAERGAYLKFFVRQRQNYIMSMEFEFNKNYELLRYYLQIENSYRCSQIGT